jgi:hypothetical protein
MEARGTMKRSNSEVKSPADNIRPTLKTSEKTSENLSQQATPLQP